MYIVPILLALLFLLSFCEWKSCGKKVEKGGWEFASCFGGFHFCLAMAFTDRSGVGGRVIGVNKTEGTVG